NNTGYAQYVADAWTQKQPATAFGHLCYDVPLAEVMTNFVNLSLARNAGWTYVTDDRGDNPWDTVPSYWSAEVGLVERINQQMASTNRTNLSTTPRTKSAMRIDAPATEGRYILQGSNDLTNWSTLATNVSARGKVNFSDPPATNRSRRFYRTTQ